MNTLTILMCAAFILSFAWIVIELTELDQDISDQFDTFHKSDSEAIDSDWEVIGNDLWSIIDNSNEKL